MHIASLARTTRASLRMMFALTLVFGFVYTALVTGIGHLVLPGRADGSLLEDSAGTVIGSALIGQSFLDANGKALPQYFQSRPSSAGAGYDALSSGPSNLGPTNPDLITSMKERRTTVSRDNAVAQSAVPPDAYTASGSGLDPDISVAYADLQVNRVARTRNLSADVVRLLVEDHTVGRDLGVFGQSRVNVVELNSALDALRH